MTATYTFDVFTSLDGNASYGPPGDWGGYWGKQGPEFLDHRRAAYDGEQRMVFGATTFGLFLQMLPAIGPEDRDAWMDRMINYPGTVVSSTLQGPVDWPDATVAKGDGVEIVRRMKAESDVPIRSHGSLSLNRALMAAGLVDRIQITVFPVVAAQTGDEPVFAGGGDFDLDLLESGTFDGRIQELVYRPTPPHLAFKLTERLGGWAAPGRAARRRRRSPG
ncbi:MAG: dihydrofolate reductase family protein [Actinobacteria bacterium]|nr:dihydrofolate reductase family protein [Actinomycetota bacterium]